MSEKDPWLDDDFDDGVIAMDDSSIDVSDWKRWDVINSYLERGEGLKRYVEIGVRTGECIRKVNAQVKLGVDPQGRKRAVTHRMTSDEFFALGHEPFDVIFVDGLHHAEQVYRDIMHGWEVLKEDGVIIVHDCNPKLKEHQVRVYRRGAVWNGDVWKGWITAKAVLQRGFVIDLDEGLGVLDKKGWKGPIQEVEVEAMLARLKWEELERERKNMLGLITFKEWEVIRYGEEWVP